MFSEQHCERCTLMPSQGGYNQPFIINKCKYIGRLIHQRFCCCKNEPFQNSMRKVMNKTVLCYDDTIISLCILLSASEVSSIYNEQFYITSKKMRSYWNTHSINVGIDIHVYVHICSQFKGTQRNTVTQSSEHLCEPDPRLNILYFMDRAVTKF